jgi:hypothetical protein
MDLRETRGVNQEVNVIEIRQWRRITFCNSVDILRHATHMRVCAQQRKLSRFDHGTSLPVIRFALSAEEVAMAESSRQKRITGRVMHEFKHGELKSGRGGKGGPVKSRR